MMQTPAALQSHMMQHIGLALTAINDDEHWHSGNKRLGDPSGKVSYVTAETEHGLLVRYRHKGGDCFTWKSWKEQGGEYIRQAPRPRKPASPPIDDMPVMLKAWQEGGRVDLDHPYIESKLIVPAGIKQTSKRYVIRPATADDPEHYLSAGTLLIPAHSNTTGDIKAFTTITQTGRKFARGSISNCHLWIGGSLGTGDGNLYISESYSTAISVHMRTSAPVVVAFSTSGLMGVGQMLRERYPEAQIVFACDNDVGVIFKSDGEERENPGIYYATKAAESISASLWVPPSEVKADWNDIHILMCPKRKTPVQF